MAGNGRRRAGLQPRAWRKKRPHPSSLTTSRGAHGVAAAWEGSGPVFIGTPGDDTLPGGADADTFILGPTASGADRIMDFTAEDRVEARGAVSGFGAGSSPTAYLRLSVADGDRQVLLNTDGVGSAFLLVAVLDSVVGLSVDQLYDDGRLLLG
jgi:Ca2+-binding RTX toxin-like protein